MDLLTPCRPIFLLQQELYQRRRSTSSELLSHAFTKTVHDADVLLWENLTPFTVNRRRPSWLFIAHQTKDELLTATTMLWTSFHESRIRFQLNAEYATFALSTTNTSPLGRMKKKSIMNELDWSGIWFLESVYDSNASKLNVPWSTIIKSWHEVDISRTFRAVEAKIVMHTFMWRFGVISFKAWKSQARFERLLSKHYFKSHEFQELIEKWDEKGVRQLN